MLRGVIASKLVLRGSATTANEKTEHDRGTCREGEPGGCVDGVLVAKLDGCCTTDGDAGCDASGCFSHVAVCIPTGVKRKSMIHYVSGQILVRR